MEINNNYTAKNIQNVDNATSGSAAKVDNFADLLSNVVDKTPNKSDSSIKDASSGKTDAPDKNSAKNNSSADNSATKDVKNPKDIQNADTQSDADTKIVTSKEVAPTDAAPKKAVNDNANANAENNNEPKSDGEKKPLIDAQQAVLALILNQGQQPVENAAPILASNTTAENVINSSDVPEITADVIQDKNNSVQNNPVLVAALTKDGDKTAAELKIAMSNKENGKAGDAKGEKTDLSVKNADAKIVSNDGLQNTNPTSNIQSANQDKNPNNLPNNTFVKNNVAHQQSPTTDAGLKTQDLSSQNANTLIATDNNATTSSASTADINKSAADQSNGIRINLDNIQSLAAIMVRKHFNGEKTFTIRLDPPELGEIKVELKIDKDKKAKAIISASNHEALGDLTKSVKELAQSLKDGGVDINEEDFEFNLNNQSDDNEFAQNAKSQSNDKPSEKKVSEDIKPEIINQINRGINRTQVWHNVRVSLIA